MNSNIAIYLETLNVEWGQIPFIKVRKQPRKNELHEITQKVDIGKMI